MRVYLIGYMGSGKSTAGKKLANMLGFRFIDLDNLIEEAQGITISEIFARQGEEAFRKIEQEMLATTFELSDAIIATGGGAPCFYDNMDAMNQHGLTIYIDMSPKALVSRLKGATEQRPILKGKSEEELLIFIESALKARLPFYTKCKTTVEGLSLSANSLNTAILSYSES